MAGVRLSWPVRPGGDWQAWLPESATPVHRGCHGLPQGAPLVLGPRDSAESDVATACRKLTELLEVGSAVVAGAGVELGAGFVSARAAGAPGDRRDAVLAALRVLGLGDLAQLGDRTATLVALFGVAATKRVAAAAERAMRDGCWAAVQLASAASDLLGPEQLEQILALRVPDGIEPMSSVLASTLALDLRRVFESYSRPRRLQLLTDLWQRVCDHLIQKRLTESQNFWLFKGLQRRRRTWEDDSAVRLVPHHHRQSVALAARWVPPWSLWRQLLRWLMQDAIAATALLHAACAVAERGLERGMWSVHDELSAAVSTISKSDFKKASRPVSGEIALPARPICYVRDLAMCLRRRDPSDPSFEPFVRTRLTAAGAYGRVVCDELVELLDEVPHAVLPLDRWDFPELQVWRAAAGYSEIRPPAQWPPPGQVVAPLVGGVADPNQPEDNPRACLARRLAIDPSATECASDLLWYADLADAMARLHGLGPAEIWTTAPLALDIWPRDPQNPMALPLNSAPAAVSGAATLVSLGAVAPPRCRDWSQLIDGLLSSGAVTRAGEFAVPETLLAENGRILPGTGVHVDIARNAKALVQWSAYMGNCIGSDFYIDEAVTGRSVLLALRAADNTIVANAELLATESSWRVPEIRGRFNEPPDPVFVRAINSWVCSIGHETDTDAISEPVPGGRRRTAHPLDGIAADLTRLARAAMAESDDALDVFSQLAGAVVTDRKILTALRRLDADRLPRRCADALCTNVLNLPALWSASGKRPLTAAIAGLPDTAVSSYPRLRTLTADAPLPSKALRALVKEPDLAAARSWEIVAIRVRAAIFALARAGDPALTHSIVHDATTEILCALVLERLHEQLAKTGLLVPTAWLGEGGWTRLAAVSLFQKRDHSGCT